MARVLAKSGRASASTIGDRRVLLANVSGRMSDSLLAFVDDLARRTSREGRTRDLYVLTCYFDGRSIARAVKTMSTAVRERKGIVSSVTVVIDVGEWIRQRVSREALKRRISGAAGVPLDAVTVTPVQFPGRLLHAKAYAALRVDKKNRRGFVVITSGNATARGTGIDPKSNIELATCVVDPQGLAEFDELMRSLVRRTPSEKALVKQSRFLRALALFSRGTFYHRWQGSLSAETRFSFQLTERGKEAARGDVDAFPGYDSESDSKSRDPVNIEEVFKSKPKTLPATFWRTYAVETVLGHWLPAGIAQLVEDCVDRTADTYVSAVERHLTDERIQDVSLKLKDEMRQFKRKGWTKGDERLVDGWHRKVARFKSDKGLIKLRVHPYESLPSILTGETRAAVLRAESSLRARLAGKQAAGTRRLIKRYLNKEVELTELDREFDRLSSEAAAKLAQRRVLR